MTDSETDEAEAIRATIAGLMERLTRYHNDPVPGLAGILALHHVVLDATANLILELHHQGQAPSAATASAAGAACDALGDLIHILPPDARQWALETAARRLERAAREGFRT
jgi:hypothetical protein